MNEKGIAHLALLPVVVGVLLVGVVGYMYVNGILEINIKPSSTDTVGNSMDSSQEIDNQGNDSDGAKDVTWAMKDDEAEDEKETPFCAKYGTLTIKKTDLFEEYSVGPGETMRDIARKTLNDEKRALDLISVNPSLQFYEIDDDLPMSMKVYIPDDKYSDEEGITSYMKARGNITFNDTKPMFGVNAPNSGTGPFTISEEIKDQVRAFGEGECVEVIYGSRGYDSNKPVFEVLKQ